MAQNAKLTVEWYYSVPSLKVLSDYTTRAAKKANGEDKSVVVELGDLYGEAREFAEGWEQQAGAAQQPPARLQEMLEEQSDWRPPEANGAPVANGAGPKEPAHLREAPAGDSGQVAQRARELEARNAALEVQVAQLNAEASRAQEAHANLSRAIGPVLEGVEQRLARIRHEQFLRQQQQLAQ